MKGTHEIFVPLPKGGMFITGVKDECDHDDKETVFMLGNGDYLFERDYRCPTNEATWEYVEHVAKQRDTYISGQTGGCSKCKKVLTLADLMGDAYWE
jgi:hypothetical protein